MKPAPRSGSIRIVRAIVRLASPSSSGSPTFSASAVEQTRVDPDRAGCRRAGLSRRGAAGAGAQSELAAQRIGRADRLHRDQPGRAAVRIVGPAHAREAGRRRGRRRPSDAAFATNCGGAGLSLRTIASPPINWRASRARPLIQPVGEKADRGQRGHRQRHRDHQQAQFTGAEIAAQLLPGQAPDRDDAKRRLAGWRRDSSRDLTRSGISRRGHGDLCATGLQATCKTAEPIAGRVMS